MATGKPMTAADFPPLSDTTLAYGEKVASAILGVDQLYRAESGDGEGIAVVDMSRGALQAAPYADYAEAAAAWTELQREAATLPELDRREYYRQLAGSTLSVIKWRTEGLSLADQLSGFLHVPQGAATRQELDALLSELRTLLNDAGYSGDLAAQAAAWQDRNQVPADEVEGRILELFSEAWDRTSELIEIPADKSDGMQVMAVRGAHFNARCNYMVRRVELNIDPVLTEASLKHLALHECYPGHYVQFKLREEWYRRGIAPADGLLSVVNTASSSPFEGIADNGHFLLNWFDEPNDHIGHILSRYRSGIGTAAAWKLHAEGQSEEQVREWLRGVALVGGDGWVENRMKFIAAPSRSVLIWSYWWGQPSVTPVMERIAPERRNQFLAYLYGRMHSVQTIAMFEEAVQ